MKINEDKEGESLASLIVSNPGLLRVSVPLWPNSSF